MAISEGDGADERRPPATVAVGGVIAGTPFAPFVLSALHRLVPPARSADERLSAPP